MAKYNEGFGVTFNDNDGGATFFYTGDGILEYQRHVKIMGKWRAKLFFIKILWRALNEIEGQALNRDISYPKWKRLKGWKA